MLIFTTLRELEETVLNEIRADFIDIIIEIGDLDRENKDQQIDLMLLFDKMAKEYDKYLEDNGMIELEENTIEMVKPLIILSLAIKAKTMDELMGYLGKLAENKEG